MRRLDPTRLIAALLLGSMGAAVLCAQQAAPPAAAEEHPQARVLDEVAAVVNNQAILKSEVEEELRLAVLDPAQGGQAQLTPQRALEQLISRALIQQQIRREDAEIAEPNEDEVKARLNELRSELPACVRSNCASAEGWAAFLAAHGLTPERMERTLRNRLEILRFIEMRFRQGIRITPEDIENYYRQVLLPQYAPGETIPKLEAVSPRIEEILLEQKVTVLFDDWLDNLRKQGDVQVLDPALEMPAAAPAAHAASSIGAAATTGKEALR
jgi:hypothetical protein